MSWIDDLNNAPDVMSYDDFFKRSTIDKLARQRKQQQQAQAKPQGNFLTSLIPTGGSIAGSLGGAAGGAAIGSIVPGVGTAIGGLLGAILGGAGGGALGKVGENAVEGEKDLGNGVGQEALFGGATSIPLTAGFKLARAGLKVGAGVGKTAASDLVKQAGEATIPKFMNKTAVPAVADVAEQTAPQAVTKPTGIAKIKSMIADRGQQMEANAGGFGVGEKASGKSPVGFYDSHKIGQDLVDEGIPAGSPRARIKGVEDALKNRGTAIDTVIEQNNSRLTTADKRQVVTNYKAALDKIPGLTQEQRNYADSLVKDVQSLKNKGDLVDFYRRLDSKIAYNRNPDGALADKQEILRALRSTVSDAADQHIPGIADLNKSYSNLINAHGYLLGGNKLVTDMAQGEKGNLINKLLSNGTMEGLKSRAGATLQKVAPQEAGQTALETAAKPGGQTLIGALTRQGGGRALLDPAAQPEQSQIDELGLAPEDYQAYNDAVSAEGLDPSTSPFESGGVAGSGGSQTASNPFGVSIEDVAQQMTKALTNGDAKTYAALSDLYDRIYKYESDQAKSGAGNPLSSAQQTQVNNSNSALTDINTVRNSLQKDPGVVFKDAIPGGSLARGLTGTTDYDAAKQNIVDVIARLRSGAAITNDEAQRYMGLLPSPGDSQQSALAKLDRLQSLLSSFANPQSSASGTDLLTALSGAQ